MNVHDIVRMISPTPEVAASRHRLDNEIRWVHITDLANPAPYLRGGELILSNALWHNTAEDAWAYAAALASRGSRALGLALFDQEKVPDGLIQACEEFEIVLLLLGDIPFMDITEKVVSRILEDRRHSSVRSVSLEQTLNSRMESGEGITALIRTLEDATQVPVWMVQRDGVVHSTSRVPPATAHSAWRAGFGSQRVWRSGTEIALPGGERITLVSIWEDRERASPGLPVSLVFNGPLRLMREHIETAATLTERYLDLLLRGDADEKQRERILRGEIMGRAATEQVAEGEFADQLDISPNSPSDRVSLIVTRAVENQQRSADVLESAITLNGLTLAAGAIVGDRVVAVLRLPVGDSANAIDRVYQDMAHVLGDELRLGLSYHESSSPLRIGELLAAASEALEIASMPGRGKHWADSSDVSPHLLLLATTPASTRSMLHAQTLEPLERYDLHHHSQLVHTLRIFLRNDCSWQRTASALHLHVNSLRYRVERVEQLTGKDLTNMGDKCDLFLALVAAQEKD